MNIYRIVLIVLSLISAWLYLRVILPPEPEPVVAETAAPAKKPAPQADKVTEAQILPAKAVTEETAPTTEPAAAKEDTAQAAANDAPAPRTEAPAASPAPDATDALKPLPAEQMRLVIETLAPEMNRNQ